MLIIRLSRVGKRNHAQYKIVLAEKTYPVKGKFNEILGSYDPHLKKIVLKNERVKYWLDKGAACSDTVYNLLISQGVIEGKKRAVKLPIKSQSEASIEESAKAEMPTAAEEKKEEPVI